MAMLKRILGTVLTAMVVVLMAIPLAIASDNYPNYPSVAQEKLKEKRQEERDQKKDAKQDTKQDASREAAKEADQRRGAEADAQMREQKKATNRGITKQSHKANQDYREKVRTSQVVAPKDMGDPDYCISQAVKQDRRRVFTASELKHYAKGYEYRNEPFFVGERDGTITLVDPLISQNLSRPLPAP